MARQTRRNNQKPGWLYILVGLLIGLIIAGIVYVTQQPKERIDYKKEIKKTTQVVANKATEVVDKTKESIDDSEFFENLPPLDMVKPTIEAIDTFENLTKDETKPLDNDALYNLQVGSFASYQHADELKAKLTLNNWSASIKKATLPDGSERHRVFVGAFLAKDVKHAKKRLAEIGVRQVVTVKAQ